MVYKTFQRSSNLFLLFTNRGGSSFYPLSCSRSRLWRRLWLLLQNMSHHMQRWNWTSVEIARRKKISPPEIRTASHELAPLSTVCDLCCKKKEQNYLALDVFNCTVHLCIIHENLNQVEAFFPTHDKYEVKVLILVTSSSSVSWVSSLFTLANF